VPVHTRQFLLGPEPREVRPDWLTRPVSDGLHLSHCPTLPVAATPHGLVVGDAIATVSPDGGPDTWSGRWIVIDDGALRLDTGGLLGCFTRVTDAGQWVSSSLEILRRLDPELTRHEDRLERNWRIMDWYPPPHSAVEGIARLLPSQALDVLTGEVRRVDLPLPNAVADAEADAEADQAASIERVRSRLVRAIRGASALAAQDGGRVWIGLTGGRDSRVVLAAAAAAGIEAMTYTFIREQTSQGDRDLPPKLAASVGFQHVRIPLDVVDPARAAEFDEHTGGGFTGGPQLQYSTGGWDRVEASAVALEGGCFEMARCYYYDRLPRDLGVSAAKAADAILERFPTQRPDGVRAWAEWAFADGTEAGLDWRDRFYLEQRVGGWLSSGLQGFDISGRRQVHIANERSVLADLLSFPQPQRRRSAHEAALVQQMAPDLAAFPYNPDAKSKGQGGDTSTGDSRGKGSGSGQSRRSGLLSRFRRG
jgi:hypothetical protein